MNVIRIILAIPIEKKKNQIPTLAKNKFQVYLSPKCRAHFKIQKTIFIS